jgi:hypothetical protein
MGFLIKMTMSFVYSVESDISNSVALSVIYLLCVVIHLQFLLYLLDHLQIAKCSDTSIIHDEESETVLAKDEICECDVPVDTGSDIKSSHNSDHVSDTPHTTAKTSKIYLRVC